MFKKLSALFLILPVISALQLDPPTAEIHPQSPVTLTWASSSEDPATFALYLANEPFNSVYALDNAVTTSDGTITVFIPGVPPNSGYIFQASSVGNINDVYSQTNQFDIT